MELLLLGLLVSLVVGGGVAVSALLYMDRDSAMKGKDQIDVLPHENFFSRHEAELEDEKFIA